MSKAPASLAERDVLKSVLALRDSIGAMRLEHLGILKITGADAEIFLQSQVTSDVLELPAGQGHLSALLDRKAHIQVVFTLYRDPDAFWLHLDKSLVSTCIERLETYLFSEDVCIEDVSAQFVAWAVQGPDTRSTLMPAFSEFSEWPVLPHQVVFSTGEPAVLLREDLLAEDGVVLVTGCERAAVFEERLAAVVSNWLAVDAWRVLRLEAGQPEPGIDYDADTLLPATGLEQVAVSYSKGCYQGQEVVAKVRTYGSVGRNLVGLIFSESLTADVTLNAPLLLCYAQGSETEIGVLKTAGFSPTLNAFIALAYLNRDTRTPGRVLDLSVLGQRVSATVTLLPFYTSTRNRDKAKALYDEALADFTADKEAEAEAKLREVIALDPHLADAYESLGVILSRRGEAHLDEAIALMKRLAEINPNEVMAHSNLSQFYARKGLIEEAEVEKAKATMLSFKLAVGGNSAVLSDEAIRAKRLQELEAKIPMFEDVLSYDATDGLANFGLGQVLFELSRPDEARRYLEASVQFQPNHTMSYLILGKTLEALAELDAAQGVYEKGIAIATRKGDLMPLKEMQARLRQ